MADKKESGLAVGDLDPGFGRNGLAELPDPTHAERIVFIAGIAVDPAMEVAQRIYVGANFGDGAAAEGYIARLLEDGTLDKSFGDEGYVLLPRGNPKVHEAITVNDFVFHESGKEITCFGTVVGWPEGYRYGIYTAAIRITSAGVIDTSFGQGGLAVYWTPSLADKKYNNDFINARQYETREALQSALNEAQGEGTFNTGGSARLVDGKILFLADNSQTGGGGYLARINLDGSLDRSFGTDGLILVTDAGTSTTRPVICWGFDIDRRGGIVVVGEVPVIRDGIVCRYDSTGARDQEFGQAGVVRFYPFSMGYSSYFPQNVKALDDGKLILLIRALPNQAGSPPPQFPAIVKLLRNGDRDPAFNNGEPRLIDLRPAIYLGYMMALDAANRILIAGYIRGTGLPTGGGISRIEPAGRPDSGFGSQGTRLYEELQPWFRIIAIQSRVNILIGMSAGGSSRIGRFIG